MPPASALYSGTVVHHRVRPRAHRLSYKMFSLLLDLDELDVLDGRLRLFSRNRFNVFGFRDRDYGATDRGRRCGCRWSGILRPPASPSMAGRSGCSPCRASSAMPSIRSASISATAATAGWLRSSMR